MSNKQTKNCQTKVDWAVEIIRFICGSEWDKERRAGHQIGERTRTKGE